MKAWKAERTLLEIQVPPKTDKSTSMNSVKKRRNIFLVVRVGPQEVELVVAFAEGYDLNILSQEFGQSILVRVAVGFGEVRVKPSPGTCMAEVERYCVTLEN